MDLAMVGVAAVLWEKEGHIDGRLVYGAVAPTPIRAYKTEAQLKKLTKLDEEDLDVVAAIASEEVKPISDVRASAEYRKDMTYQLTKRAITQAHQALQEL